MEKRKLDIGCGGHKVAGAIGLDWIGATQADVICDLRQFPWPLQESSFDEIYAYNVLEHLSDTVATMEEIHRVGREGALVHIRTPHFASLESWEDPTHVHHFSLESFDYFCDGTRHVGHYSPKRFRVVAKKLHFGGHPISIMGRMLCAMNPRKYEKRWAFMFRPGGMEITLAVVKEKRV
jgi:2-polyprenyl-3-methyl-5-hydroxy-6-metoxy-1,4-benzoquinol methylase